MKPNSTRLISCWLTNTLEILIGLPEYQYQEHLIDIHNAFRKGAEILAQNHCEYTKLHKGHGIDEYHWQILTQEEYWAPDQARDMRAIIANVLEVSMTIAGMPAIPLPGHYCAALIATVVAPANRLLACTKVPDTFDAVHASGLLGTAEVKDMGVQQMMALVIAYSGGYPNEPPAHRLPLETKEAMKAHSKK